MRCDNGKGLGESEAQQGNRGRTQLRALEIEIFSLPQAPQQGVPQLQESGKRLGNGTDLLRYKRTKRPETSFRGRFEQTHEPSGKKGGLQRRFPAAPAQRFGLFDRGVDGRQVQIDGHIHVLETLSH
jgi:hypothetical protein